MLSKCIKNIHDTLKTTIATTALTAFEYENF